MEELSKHPRLARRGQVYWFRAKVPADLRLHYAPKQEIIFSLRTRDLKEALEKVRVEAVKLDQEFAVARRKQAENPQTTLSDTEIERLSAIYLQQLMEEDEEARRYGLGSDAVYAAVKAQLEQVPTVASFDEADAHSEEGLSEREFMKLGETLEIVGLAHKEALARGRTSIVEDEVDELLSCNGVQLDKQSESYRKLSYAILKASVSAHDMQERRHKGEVVDTPRAPAAFRTQQSPHNGPAMRFSELYGKWKAQHKGPEKTKEEFGVQVRRFIEVNGDLFVHEINPAHVREFMEAMLKMPVRLSRAQRAMTVPEILEAYEGAEVPRLAARTVREKSMAAVRAVLGHAKAVRQHSDNPASGITVSVSREARRRKPYPFTIAELTLLFNSPVFVEGERPSGGGGEAAKWLPLIALFTGARLEEIAQLRVDDIKTEDGVKYFFIGADPETQPVKNEQSRRKTPIHPELIKLGLLDYGAEMEKAGQDRLFPKVTSKDEKSSTAWSKWFGRYKKKCGITGKGKVFHSFRHSAKRALREAKVEKALRDALMGHGFSDDAEEYGVDEEGLGVSLPTLFEALSKMRYPGLDLSHLHPRGGDEK